MKNKITILGNLIFDNWFLSVINTLIYIYSLYLELKYIFVDDFYRLSVYKRYGNEEEFLKFLSSERSLDFLNYLWMPIHVIGIALFTTICIFLGFNIMGIRLAFNKAFKYSLQASIVFSFNYLLLTLLKILGVVTYNYNTVDDVYFVQSLGRLFTRFNWPDWAYGILGRISIVEFLFYFVLSIIIAKSIKINFKTSLYKTGISYGIGLCFLGIITTFIGFII